MDDILTAPQTNVQTPLSRFCCGFVAQPVVQQVHNASKQTWPWVHIL